MEYRDWRVPYSACLTSQELLNSNFPRYFYSLFLKGSLLKIYFIDIMQDVTYKLHLKLVVSRPYRISFFIHDLIFGSFAEEEPAE
jgi:hypothetical protein